MYKKKFLFTLSIGLNNCRREEKVELEFDDHTTSSEEDEIAQGNWHAWCDNFIDGGPLEIKE